ncbi:AsmA-like C-terminal region-containing protein [Albidovulum sp.]
MSEEAEATTARRRLSRRHRVGLWILVPLALSALAAGLLVLGLTGRTLAVPDWIVARIEARANTVLAGAATVRVGGADLLVDASFVPHVRLRDAVLFSAQGRPIATIPDIRTTLRGRPLVSGRVLPRRLWLRGVQVELERQRDGSLDFVLGGGEGLAGAARSPRELLDAIDRVFTLPGLSEIESIDVTGLNVAFRDLRSGRAWAVSDGLLQLSQDPQRVAIRLKMALAEQGRSPANAIIAFETVKNSPESSVSAVVSNVLARDLAAQLPALSWLAALDAPISGSLQSRVDGEGVFQPLVATLTVGAGVLQPLPDVKPVAFHSARLRLSYDPQAEEIAFDRIELNGATLRMRAQATARLKEIDASGLPGSLVAQLRIDDFQAAPEGVFESPVTFERGIIDARIVLDPFRVDLGQLVLIDRAGRVTVKGQARAEPEGWSLSMDSAIDAITADRLLALWPVGLVPKTRAWLAENVAASDMSDVRAALRLRPGEEPRLSLTYAFRGTEVRVIRTLPPIRDGAGYAAISDNSYTLVVDRGHVVSPEGGRVDVAGSVMRIPDLRIIPAPARFTLRTDSSIRAALSLLDQPPFEFLSKAGKPVDLAEGRARVEATLDLLLKKKILPEDVDFLVTARLSEVRSEKIAPGRTIAADGLDLVATRSGMEISGAATLSGVPFDFVWRQKFGPEGKGRSAAEGTIELSRRFLDAFGIGLPETIVTGSGRGRFSLDLQAGQPAAFTLSSDLAGLSLALPGIAWRKGPGQTGQFDIAGRLGAPPDLDRFELSAPGLKMTGALTLRADGALDRLALGPVSLGGWFDGSVLIEGRGKGVAPAVTVTGGQLDLRRAAFAPASGGGSAAGPVRLALDRLTVSQGIELRGVRGEIDAKDGGVAGALTGRVNGEAPIEVAILPQTGRPGFRIRAQDAGAAMRAAGIFTRGVGGTLDLTLRPQAQGVAGDGRYDGRLEIRDIRVVDAPALAALLDAVSVVGLLNQLNGPGLHFARVEGDFLLTPDAVEIRRGSAVGPSLGISGAGVYLSDRRQIDIQGTISPLYLVNGIGQVFSRRGEGLFGFNYRLRGPADSPTVSVNPFSILTPGMFREIFRSDPAKLAK